MSDIKALIDGEELSSWDTNFHAYVKSDGKTHVTLDGGFTAAELRWIADFMDGVRPSTLAPADTVGRE